MNESKFGYKERVNWLIQTKKQSEGMTLSAELQSQIDMVEREVYEFEQKAFEVIMGNIENELGEIEKLKKIAETSNNEDFQQFVTSEINRHMENITAYGNQIYSLYSREILISVFEDRRKACLGNIEYNKKKLEENPEDKMSMVMIGSEEKMLAKTEMAISFLTGTAKEMVDSVLPQSEIGRKLI